MLEYYPWSVNVLHECIADSKRGRIPTLDLELSAKCSGASCIYCDSKPSVCPEGAPNELDFPTLREAILEGRKHGLKWVYTCGLGEPMEDPKFWDLVILLRENGIRLSMFSNGIFIRNHEIAKKLKESNVCIILKMDTFQEENFDRILGRPGTAKKVYRARDLLLDVGYGADGKGYTDLAFSIVPTSLSIDGIPEVLSFCEEHGIFASIGELEQAGEVVTNNLNDTLSISQDQLFQLKKLADSYTDCSYSRPFCPCIMTGVHIDNLGNCVVDRDTGLNCKWFLLKDPCVEVVGNLRKDKLNVLCRTTSAYVRSAFTEHKELIESSCDKSFTFGGCGGNPRDLIALIQKELIE